jgi:hypothetical protein
MASSSTSSSSMVTSAPISTSLSNIINYVSLKLDETNYLLWRSQFVPILVANDLYGYVDGSITPPPTIINSTEGKESPNPDFLSWRKTDQFVLSCINATLTQSILAQVLGHSTAHQVWASLHLMFLEQSQARFDLLKGDIQSIQKGTSSISEYLNRLKHIADSLAALCRGPFFQSTVDQIQHLSDPLGVQSPTTLVIHGRRNMRKNSPKAIHRAQSPKEERKAQPTWSSNSSLPHKGILK